MSDRGGEEDKEDEESHLDTVHGRMQGRTGSMLVRSRQATLALGGMVAAHAAQCAALAVAWGEAIARHWDPLTHL
jgi:hypothetical protein